MIGAFRELCGHGFRCDGGPRHSRRSVGSEHGRRIAQEATVEAALAPGGPCPVGPQFPAVAVADRRRERASVCRSGPATVPPHRPRAPRSDAQLRCSATIPTSCSPRSAGPRRCTTCRTRPTPITWPVSRSSAPAVADQDIALAAAIPRAPDRPALVLVVAGAQWGHRADGFARRPLQESRCAESRRRASWRRW